MSTFDIIRCDLSQDEYLVWKWVPTKSPEKRQNQIRWNSKVRVREGETAVFFYTQGGGGNPIDLVDGPADFSIDTKNLPVISGVLGMFYGGDSPFQAELFFVNKRLSLQFKWGVPYFDAFDSDPAYRYLPVPIAAHGTITFKITDVRRFIAIQGLEKVTIETLREKILPQIRSVVKGNLVNLAMARQIPLVQIGAFTEQLGESLAPSIETGLAGFGAALASFVVEGIEVNKESEGFRTLMKVTRDQMVANVSTQGSLARQNLADSQKINAEHLKESLGIQRKQLDNRQTLQTQSDFLPVHQINLQADVAKAAATSLGQMGGSGEGGGGGAELGTAAVSLGLGSAVGSVLGRQIVGSLQGVFNPQVFTHCPKCGGSIPTGANFCPQCGTPVAQNSSVVSSAPSMVQLARDGARLGGFSLDEINRKLADGSLRANDLAWMSGMPQWRELSSIPGVLIPPPLPGTECPPPLPK